MIANKKNKERMVPELRFKEFEGEWVSSKLESLSSNGFNNGVFNDPKKVGSGYRLINVKDMYVGFSVNVDLLTLLQLEKKEFLKNKVEYGDIFFTRSSLVKEGIAHSNIFLSKENDVTYDGHLIKISPKIEMVFPVFLSYLFKIATIRKQLISRGKTGTMTTIGQKDMSSLKVVFPQVPEQKKIATFLSTIDQKIQQLTRKKELLESYKKGLMQQLFSGELRFKPDQSHAEGDEEGKEYPDWEEKTLKDLSIRIGDGIHSTPIYDENGHYYFVNGNNLTKGEIIINSSTKRVSESEYLKHNRELGKGTILLSINGTIGNIAFYQNEKIVLGKSACYINVNNSVNKYFIYQLLQTFRIQNYFVSYSTGSTIKNLSLKTIRETKVYLPIEDEQQKIATYLSNIDKKINSIQTQITKTQTFKRGLLQKMFV